MKRRCYFLDNLPFFTHNYGTGEYQIDEETGDKIATDTRKLGSTLMGTMIDEVNNFCNPKIKENWSRGPHQQVREIELSRLNLST